MFILIFILIFNLVFILVIGFLTVIGVVVSASALVTGITGTSMVLELPMPLVFGSLRRGALAGGASGTEVGGVIPEEAMVL